MTSTAMNPTRCDYSRSLTTPHVFTSERAELVHINEQIHLLDNHVSQLNTLRAVLHRRSCQLRSLFAPINALPVDVLSYIFLQVVLSEEDSDYPHFYWSQERLAAALTLSSVSTHFRHVAFDTPELWKKIPLHIVDSRAILKAYSLLHHCIALAPHVDVSIYDELDEQEAGLAIESLLTFDTMQKMRSFQLFESAHASNLWINTLKDFTPPLDTLSIDYSETVSFCLDFGAFAGLARLQISCPEGLNVPIVVAPSVEYFKVDGMSPGMVVSLLYQCPNLVECIVSETETEEPDDSIFTEPLTLNHLKTLSFGPMTAIETSPSMENLCLPSLECLRFFERGRESKFIGVFSLCRVASSTLTTLNVRSWSNMLDHTDLYRLCQLPFPKLKQLDITLYHWSPFSSAIRALSMLESECSNTERLPLPSLRYITLHCGTTVVPHVLLNLLKKWRIGQAFHFHIRFFSYPPTSAIWSPQLREELASVVGERRVEITWDNVKLLQQT